jgi:predicted GIY-YIG superfamily endonuclease
MKPLISRVGTVYLLHFDKPYKHARHYVGWTQDLDARLAKHARGHGARLLEVVRDAGIVWTLARTWPGTRNRERQIKRQGGAARRCPLCGITPRTTQRVMPIDRLDPAHIAELDVAVDQLIKSWKESQ